MIDWDSRRRVIEIHVRGILDAIGEDPTREGLADTPARVARWWQEFAAYDPGSLDTVFQAVHADQMVALQGIRVWSLCEHHLLPFWCDITMGYIADDKVIGLSKMARIAHKHAHRLQLQERLVSGIADDLRSIVGENVAVYASGEHLCMSMRGIRSPGLMKSSSLHGVFRNEPEARAEFMALTR